MEDNTFESILKEIDIALKTEDWQTNVAKIIESYRKLVNILPMLESFNERNDLFLSKRLIKREFENIKGITEISCNRYKIKVNII